MLLSLVRDKLKKGVSAKIWGKRKIYRGAFIGSGRNSGKQLVFKKSRRKKGIEAVHGASLPREFERQNMAKIFNKTINKRFPILFKRALDFHLMKAKGEFKVVIALSSLSFSKGETRRNIIMNNSTPSDLKEFIHIFSIMVTGCSAVFVGMFFVNW